MTNQKPFCPSCLSRRYLVHLDDACTTWQISVDLGEPGAVAVEAPVQEVDLDVPADVPAQPFTMTPQPAPRRRR